MARLMLFPVLLVAACLSAGLYGALHNQISYTVSPDYFHAFKFHQFDIPQHLHGRLGASLVGWYASWWMGVFLGVPVLIVGLIFPDCRSYLGHSVIAFAVVAGTTLLAGVGALLWANLSINEASLPGAWYPEQVADQVAFARAGIMHDFSYLGGFLGILTGSVYLIVARVRRQR